MRITKFGHACVRIEHDGQVVVIDPGAFTEPEAVDGATAVLVTHEHADHLHVDHLRATDAPVFTIEAVRAQIAEADPGVAERVTLVSPGEQVDVGLPVTAVGELHAVIHEDLPRVHNSGYVVDVGSLRVYHPGDSFTPPGGPVDVLCCRCTRRGARSPRSSTSAARSVPRARSPCTTGCSTTPGSASSAATSSVLLGETAYERLRPGTDLSL